MLSLMTLIMGLAPVCAPLLGGALLGIGGWRSIFWVLVGFGTLLSLAVALWLRLLP